MIVWFRRPVLLLVVVLTISLSYAQAYAFIPEGSDIIKLSVKKIVEPVGLKVVQKRKIYNEQTEQIKTEPSFIEITEKLWFAYPGKFRSEAIAGSHDMICVESKGQFVKVIDEFIESKKKSLTDLYTDILLFRQPESLTKKLIASGVDVTISSFKRHADKIYFVVGVPPDENRLSSSLWVEKNSDFPGRYTIRKDGLFLDIFYKDWQRVSKTWYPMKIIIFLDGALFSEIDVEKFELEADFEKNLFNVKRLINIFPESNNYSNESGSLRNESDELGKSITDFKKLYE